MSIILADNFRIPVDRAAGQRIGIIGKSGSGKTNSQRVIAAGWHAHIGAFTVVDPMAQFLDLRALPNTIVAGGRQADVPLSVEDAPALAQSSLTEGISIILDTSDLPRAQEQAVVTAYLETLWETVRTGETARPYALLIDEAEIFSPQSDTPPTREIIADIAKRGRHRGLTSVLATQRPARLDKNFLTQTSILIAHRLFSVDAKPLTEQIPMSEKDLRAKLSRLPTGAALVVADPAFIGDADFVEIQVRLSEGFTPSADRVVPVVVTASPPTSVAIVPSPDLTARVEALEQEKAELLRINRDLHGELARLREQLAQAESRAPVQQMPLLSSVEARASEQQAAVVMTERVTERTVERTFAAAASSRSLSLKVKAQRRKLVVLEDWLRERTRTQKAVLLAFLAEPTTRHKGNALAQALDLQPRTYHDAARVFVESDKLAGLIRRDAFFGRTYDTFVYTVDEQWFARAFPNLDIETVKTAILRAVAA